MKNTSVVDAEDWIKFNLPVDALRFIYEPFTLYPSPYDVDGINKFVEGLLLLIYPAVQFWPKCPVLQCNCIPDKKTILLLYKYW